MNSRSASKVINTPYTEQANKQTQQFGTLCGATVAFFRKHLP